MKSRKGKTNLQSNLINNLNYKDIFIIFGGWYMMMVINYLTLGFSFNYTPMLTGLFHYLFVLTGRFLYLTLFIFYLISFYSVGFTELGLEIKNIKRQIITSLFLLLGLFVATLFFINIPLSFKTMVPHFNPLYRASTPDILVNSILPVFFFMIPNTILALSELVLLIIIVYHLFSLKFNYLFSMILSALFYSIILLNFTPSRILMNFIVAFISIFLYQRSKNSLISPAIFLSAYYTFYIFYIYGWNFLRF